MSETSGGPRYPKDARLGSPHDNPIRWVNNKLEQTITSKSTPEEAGALKTALQISRSEPVTYPSANASPILNEKVRTLVLEALSASEKPFSNQELLSNLKGLWEESKGEREATYDPETLATMEALFGLWSSEIQNPQDKTVPRVIKSVGRWMGRKSRDLVREPALAITLSSILAAQAIARKTQTTSEEDNPLKSLVHKAAYAAQTLPVKAELDSQAGNPQWKKALNSYPVKTALSAGYNAASNLGELGFAAAGVATEAWNPLANQDVSLSVLITLGTYAFWGVGMWKNGTSQLENYKKNGFPPSSVTAKSYYDFVSKITDDEKLRAVAFGIGFSQWQVFLELAHLALASGAGAGLKHFDPSRDELTQVLAYMSGANIAVGGFNLTQSRVPAAANWVKEQAPKLKQVGNSLVQRVKGSPKIPKTPTK